MGAIFSKPKAPQIAPPPPPKDPAPEPPVENEPEVSEARRKERKRQSRSANRRRTILTSPQGLTDETLGGDKGKVLLGQ